MTNALSPTSPQRTNTRIAERFRGFLPVVVDVETGGFNARSDALLEIAAVLLELRAGELKPAESFRYLIKPFPGLNIEPASLRVTGIDPWHPLRAAQEEGEALRELFRHVRRAVREATCKRAILVGHNASFDLGFLNAAVERNEIKRNPFHPFSSFDTATVGGLAFGQTVLRHAVEASGLPWDSEQAHSALYDARMTAELFCEGVNRYRTIYEKAAESK
jgi:ribonuclease T